MAKVANDLPQTVSGPFSQWCEPLAKSRQNHNFLTDEFQPMTPLCTKFMGHTSDIVDYRRCKVGNGLYIERIPEDTPR